MEWVLAKTLLSLTAVLGAMIGVAYVLRRYVYRGTAGGNAAVPVDLLGQRAFGPKRSVMVLRVLNTVVVVGMTEHGMQTLATIDDEASLMELEEKLDERKSSSRVAGGSTPAGIPAFALHLESAMKQFLSRHGIGNGASVPSGTSRRSNGRRS